MTAAGRRSRPGPGLGGLLAVALAVSGCATASGEGSDEPGAAAGLDPAGATGAGDPRASAAERPDPAVDLSTSPLRATLRQYRRDTVVRRLQVTVDNPDGPDVTVAGVRLETSAFDPEPETPKDAVVAQGQRLDLPVPYGAARCGGGPVTAAVAVARLRAGGGPATEHRLPVDATGTDLLRRLHERECAERGLQAAVGVSLAGPWTRVESAGGPALEAVVRLVRRRPGVAVRLDLLDRSTLFTVEPVGPGPPNEPVPPAEPAPAEPGTSAAPLARLDPGRAEAGLPVRLTAARCDPHALAEVKKAYRFGAWLSVDDGAPVATVLEPDAEGRAALDGLLRDSCLPG